MSVYCSRQYCGPFVGGHERLRCSLWHADRRLAKLTNAVQMHWSGLSGQRNCVVEIVGLSSRKLEDRNRNRRRFSARAEKVEDRQVRPLDEVLQEHAQRLMKKVLNITTPNKFLLAIAGCPGSGKTTAAGRLKSILQDLAASNNLSSADLVEVSSMDGFHYYRKELDAMENPEEAHARRGAHWTFNADQFVQAVKSLKQEGHALLPSFDHAYGDPVEKDVSISKQTKLIIIEGNYLLLDTEPWTQLKSVFDESWFIDCDIDIAMARVIHRQVRNGSPASVAEERVANNDRPNAELILTTASRADHIMKPDAHSLLPAKDST